MNKEFVNYEQALALKELGFDEKCLFWYNPILLINLQGDCWKNSNKWLSIEQCTAPLKQQVFKFFREKYQLQYTITWNKFYEKTPQQWEVRKNWTDEPSIPYGYGGMCSTYEEAEDACIDKLISILKENNNGK